MGLMRTSCRQIFVYSLFSEKGFTSAMEKKHIFTRPPPRGRLSSFASQYFYDGGYKIHVYNGIKLGDLIRAFAITTNIFDRGKENNQTLPVRLTDYYGLLYLINSSDYKYSNKEVRV